jgi:hypothetical protein
MLPIRTAKKAVMTNRKYSSQRNASLYLVYRSGFEKGPSWIKSQEDSSPLTVRAYWDMLDVLQSNWFSTVHVQSLVNTAGLRHCVPDYIDFLLPVFHTLLLSFVRYPIPCTNHHGFTSWLFISPRVILKVMKCIKYRNEVSNEYHSESHEHTTTGKDFPIRN